MPRIAYSDLRVNPIMEFTLIGSFWSYLKAILQSLSSIFYSEG
jgi:hypothetical protein